MKLIMENWRRFIQETDEPSLEDRWNERVKDVTREGFMADILDDGESVDIILFRRENGQWEEEAKVHVYRPEGRWEGANCYGAWEIVKSAAIEEGKMGPIAYDIAMEYAGKAGLMADRDIVSDEAQNVWQKYLDSRSDISPKQHPADKKNTGSLDWEKNPFITPNNPEDDCQQEMFMDRIWDKSRFDPGRYEDEEAYIESPLTKAFVKKGGRPIIDALGKAGRLKLNDRAKEHLGIGK